MNDGLGDPTEKELPSHLLGQPSLSTEVSNTEGSIFTADMSSYVICTSTEVLPSSNDQSPPKTWYQCRRCGKHFGRLDHVKRHCRSRGSICLSKGLLLMLGRCERADVLVQSMLERLQSKVTSSLMSMSSVYAQVDHPFWQRSSGSP